MDFNNGIENDQNLIPVKIGLLDLLKGSIGAQFVIPVYQRNYTWTANHEVKQLLDDIDAVVRGERKKHFIGIIIYLEKNVSFSDRERSLIDGQQRLTTLFLILYAIKHILQEQGDIKNAEKIEKIFLINEYSETNKLKLKPLVADDEVYQQIVNGDFENIKANESKVYKNYLYIKSFIKHELVDFSIDEFFSAINKLYLVCVPVGLNDYPQKIFESINATGAKLTASDLIRNFLLMPIVSDKQDNYYVNFWKPIEDIFDNDSKKMQDFFRFFLTAKKGTTVLRSNVYSEFTQWYANSVHEYTEDGIFKLILRYAKYYQAIYKLPIDELDKELRLPIEEFRYTSSEMVAPLLMELYSLNKTKDILGSQFLTNDNFASIVTILNSYLMRRALCGLDTSDITKYFPSLLKSLMLECKDDFSGIVTVFKKYLIDRNKGTGRLMPDDKMLAERIKTANMYTLRQAVLNFFKKLESEDNPATVDFSKLSIEHLMPQTPSNEWLNALNVEKNEYEENIHRLGNLTLAARQDNSKMGNKPWEYKNSVLSSTKHIKMNSALLEKETWNIDEINKRTDELIADIIRLYPFYGSKEDSSDNRIAISIDFPDGYAQAYFYLDNGQVTIFEGSNLNESFDNKDSYTDIEDQRSKLLDDEIIGYKDDRLMFLQDYSMYPKKQSATALSSSAMLVLHGSRNGKDCWKIADSRSVGEYLLENKKNNDNE